MPGDSIPVTIHFTTRPASLQSSADIIGVNALYRQLHSTIIIYYLSGHVFGKEAIHFFMLIQGNLTNGTFK